MAATMLEAAAGELVVKGLRRRGGICASASAGSSKNSVAMGRFMFFKSYTLPTVPQVAGTSKPNWLKYERLLRLSDLAQGALEKQQGVFPNVFRETSVTR